MRGALLFLLLLVAGGCTTPVNEVLPLSRAIVGNSVVADVRTIIHPSAAAAVAALDEQVLARRSGEPGEARALPLADLVTRSITERSRAWGLTSGRRLRVIAEIDGVSVPGTAAAMFGREDRLTGTAYLRDHETDEPLGQLYVRIRRGNGGLIATVVRGGGVRERLAAQFADQIASALSGRRSPPR